MDLRSQKQLNVSPQNERITSQGVSEGVLGLPEVWEGVQLCLIAWISNLSSDHAKERATSASTPAFFKYFVKLIVRTVTLVHLPQAQFPTEGPES